MAMKKKNLFSLVICCALLASVAQAQNFGMGIMIGDPTALSFKSWQSATHAWDGGIGWNSGGSSIMHVHVDYLEHNATVIHAETGQALVYYGLGARVQATSGSSTVGLRIPLGMSYRWSQSNMEAFLEVVPVFNLIPGTSFDTDASLGARVYFN